VERLWIKISQFDDSFQALCRTGVRCSFYKSKVLIINVFWSYTRE